MSKFIPKIFIKNLVAYTDIVNLINSKIILKKKGENYYAICPFHNEKTPSFSVNRKRQFFHCFGCGIHGNVIDFLMRYDHLHFIECIEELSAINNLPIPYENHNLNELQHRQYLYEIMEKLSVFYHKNLLSEKSLVLKNYLKTRGLNLNIIKHFSIGYASNNLKNNILKIFNSCNNKILKMLSNAGILIINSYGKYYDRFRYRIMFPIKNKYGKIIGFGGRSLNNNILPKYINSPETDIFHKGYQLYGLYNIFKNNLKLSYILIVEGYMDVITLTKFGIKYVVGTLGTATTSYHIQYLFQLTDKIIFCYDGDYSGKKAAWRTLKKVLPYMQDGRELKFTFLPEGEDPDSYIKKTGKYKFIKKIKESISFEKFLFNSIIKNIDLSNHYNRIKLSKSILPLINIIPGKIFRIYMIQKLGKIIGILDNITLQKLITKKNDTIPFFQLKQNILNILIGLIVQNTQLATITPSLKNLENEKEIKLQLFIQIIKYCTIYPNITTGELLELYRGTKFSKYLKIIAVWNHMIAEEKIENMFKDTLNKIQNFILEKKYNLLIQKERLQGLSWKERREVWSINLTLNKNK